MAAQEKRQKDGGKKISEFDADEDVREAARFVLCHRKGKSPFESEKSQDSFPGCRAFIPNARKIRYKLLPYRTDAPAPEVSFSVGEVAR